MRYGLFSDVHSNREAFEAVLAALKKEKVDGYVFLGDIVGYGAEPKDCLKLLRDLADNADCRCVAGNHDYAVCGRTPYDHYGPYAIKAIEWTKTVLDDADLKFLAQMDLVQHVDQFTIVHANLQAPQEWGYIFDIDDAYPNFQLMRDKLCFIGHSHKPVVFTEGEYVDWFIEEKIVVENNHKYIVNIGSVGQPRDGNPKAAYAVYDTATGIIEIKRLAYDIAAVQRKIIQAGLPKVLAERLSKGK